jgi:predicted DNA binding CopG/RHH family protein
MPGQRKKGIVRISLTLTEEQLEAAKEEAGRRGVDRLVVIREAIVEHVKRRRSVAPKKKPQ